MGGELIFVVRVQFSLQALSVHNFTLWVSKLASVSTDGRIKTQIASVAGDVREPVWSPFPRP